MFRIKSRRKLEQRRREEEMLQLKRKPVLLTSTPVTSLTEDTPTAGFTLTVSGGIPPYSAVLFGGSTIPGLTTVGGSSPAFTINAGTPTDPDVHDQTIRVTDSKGSIAELTFTVTVEALLGDLVAVASASRLSGTAPLSVFFDAISTTSTEVTYPFHDIDYTWDFDDLTAGDWTYGSVTDKNTAKNAIAGHVFDTPGTYDVVVTAKDGVNTDTDTVTITVADPEDTYTPIADGGLGGITYCISTAGDFTGAPSFAVTVGGGAATIPDASTDFAHYVNTYAALRSYTNVRILFRAGETYTCAPATTSITMVGPGPVHVGSFGSGSVPLINLTNGVSTTSIFKRNPGAAGSNAGNWKIIDLKFDANGNSGVGLCKVDRTFPHVLVYRVETNGLGKSISGDTAASGEWVQYLFAVDCNFHNATLAGQSCIFHNGSYGMCCLGNRLYDSTAAEFIMRMNLGQKVVVANSYHANSANVTTGPAGGKTTLNIRGSELITEYIVVYNNILDPILGSGNFSTAPQGNETAGSLDDIVRDVIVDSNIIFMTPTGRGCHTSTTGTRTTFRNNICIGGGTSAQAYLVTVMGRASTNQIIVDDLWVYNNSIYVASSVTGGINVLLAGVQGIAAGTFDCVNNIVYAPGCASTSLVVKNTTAVQGVVRNNTSDANLIAHVDMKYTTVPPVSTLGLTASQMNNIFDDLTLQGTSPGLGTGLIEQKALCDLFGVFRTGTVGVSACNWGAIE
jgi:hypothetical protein